MTSRSYALVGVAFSSIISCCCITTGVSIIATRGVSSVAPVMGHSVLSAEALTLILDLLVTICTESTGFVHGISLRSALASESRLPFNTNLRLLTAACGWRNPNGALLNGIMAVLLIISYTSTSLILYDDFTVKDDTDIVMDIAIAGLPLLFLGVALLLQVVIALSGMRAVKILTWSSSPFDLTAALVHHSRLIPVPFQCMRGVSDGYWGPAKPLESQPSAWLAHPRIRKVIISLWGLVVACAGWAALVTYLVKMHGVLPYLLYLYSASTTVRQWILTLVSLAVVQAPLTLGLHCLELIVNVIQNERQWRCATGRKGLQMSTNPLKAAFVNPLGLIHFVMKPALHWMFGLSCTIDGVAGGEVFAYVAIVMHTAQIWNLCIALFILLSFFTLVALRRPRGPQPVTYGHLQTLANLVDGWSPVMWWGHKGDGIPYCHAGTSDHPLPDVKMDCVYAGSGVDSPAFVPSI